MRRRGQMDEEPMLGKVGGAESCAVCIVSGDAGTHVVAGLR